MKKKVETVEERDQKSLQKVTEFVLDKLRRGAAFTLKDITAKVSSAERYLSNPLFTKSRNMYNFVLNKYMYSLQAWPPGFGEAFDLHNLLCNNPHYLACLLQVWSAPGDKKSIATEEKRRKKLWDNARVHIMEIARKFRETGEMPDDMLREVILRHLIQPEAERREVMNILTKYNITPIAKPTEEASDAVPN